MTRAFAAAAALAVGSVGVLAGSAAAQTTSYAVAHPGAALTTRAVSVSATTPALSTEDFTLPVGPEPDGTPVSLDVSVVTPAAEGKHPAVLLAHGFGGSKADTKDLAERLAAKGYVAVTWTARGFGASGGRIHLMDPEFEVADTVALIDLVAARPDVHLDGSGDPRLGIVGGSYGGATALMAAGADTRVDAIVPSITWNDLSSALFPQSVEGSTEPGPAKQLWISRFFAASVAGASRTRESGSAPSTRPTDGALAQTGGDRARPGLLCGRFDPTLCDLLLTAAESGDPSPELITLLKAHSPAASLDKVTAPTLLIQGMGDSLFGLDQSDATARALLAKGTPVAVRWMDGGHDGPSSTATSDEDAALTWLDHYLRPGNGATTASTTPSSDVLPLPAFTYAAPLPRRAEVAPLLSLPAYPSMAGDTTKRLRLRTPSRALPILTPPGGAPASVTSVPGLGSIATVLPTYQLAALPGQSMALDAFTVGDPIQVVGAPRIRLRVTSTAPTVTMFVSLWQVQTPTASQPRRLVAPVRAKVTPGVPTELVVDLPAATWTMPSGSTWRVLITSTDTAYANPRDARADVVEVVDGSLVLPTATGTPLRGAAGARDTESIGVAIAIGAVLLALLGLALWRRRQRRQHPFREDLADVPLVVDDLVKTYADGHRAVDDVSWRAEKGQVVGLLGPNGAGKTTTMRMLLGLIKPDSGEVHVMGAPVSAGAPVLSRVGALVEGPGFLPHLTGRQNLEAYWRATGRPMEEAGFEDALSVAALAGALERPVRTYSQGMKQRLGIAQAMLGLPELLLLDEPTNGLDPPQIAAMRPILHAYAAAGRTVVVSSHLLAEVEQTCSHVVVMHAGRVVTAGRVDELIASADTTVFELGSRHDLDAAVTRLREVPGVTAVEIDDDSDAPRITVTSQLPRADVVRATVESGADVVGVGSRRHLEEVFLGVIATAQGADSPDSSGTLIERLRQIRSR
jgi:ABC-2 type transport system ATP-binding protein